MFCDQCGAPVQPGANFCTRCGKRLVPGFPPQPFAPLPITSQPLPPPAYVPPHPPARVVPTGRVRHHLHLIAIFWLIFAALRLIGVFWIFAVGRIAMPAFIDGIISLSQPLGHHFLFGRFISESLAFIAVWICFWAGLEIFAVWGLLARAPWARILIIVLAILSIFRFPLGTVLGIYTLWVFLPAHAAAEYGQLSQSA
jgi:hypothetical protein